MMPPKKVSRSKRSYGNGAWTCHHYEASWILLLLTLNQSSASFFVLYYNMMTIRQTLATQRAHSRKSSEQPKSAEKKWELSDFEILKTMGRGKFGEVVLAREKKSDYIVALKRMNRREVEESNFIEQVKRQIIIQSTLNHHNLLKLFGYFWDQQAIYLILEYAPRGELYGLLRQASKFQEQKVSCIIRQVCDGLAYLHAHSIIHRDIKPENILVSVDRIKIGDFGWSIFTKNRRETICGTLDYLSPEMVTGKTHDEKVDVWGVGVLAYQLATGKPPFEDQTERNTYNRIIESEVCFPSFISVDLRTFIRKCLHKNPQKRLSISALLQQPFLSKYQHQQLIL